MKTLPSCLCIFGLAGLATAGGAAALMDQIGPDTGADIDTSNMLANQIFEASFSVYDIACVDDFDNPTGMPAGGVDLVMGGWNGYVSVDGVAGMQVNFYTDENAAGASLAGDVASQDYAGSPVGDPNWTLAGYDLVGVSGMWSLNTGMNYVALIPINEFGVNGQTGAAISFVGNLEAWQANPAGGFGFGPLQLMPNNIALRVIGGSSDPCDIPLPACWGDITGPMGVPDGLINVDDVLGVIGSFGQVGDGTSRPLGDIAPLPAGNCEVDVDDLLAMLGVFNGDCLPRGACCFGIDGCYEDVKEGDCTGSWLGEGSACSECVVGACCFADGSCDFVYEPDCTGAFQGQDVLCADVTCVEAPANTVCSGAVTISEGDTGIDNTAALTDGPADFTLCDNFDVEQIHNDLWYRYVASCDGTVTISTCDTVDFDSRLAVYDVCDGTMIVCNDDCGGANNTLSSELALDMVASEEIVIRVGSFAEGGTGTGVLSVSCVTPAPGACCLVEDCLDGLMPTDCADFGGVYQGAGTTCDGVSCVAEGNTCDEAMDFVDGANSFDTSDASDSGFGEPDETMCEGTYLEWAASPDQWGKYLVVGDGTLTVSLCDSASYDTSLVLYEGPDCNSLTQVACNGDTTVETGCQSYYSGVYDMPVTGGSTIYIRMGGWQAATGPGTCTITFTSAGAVGACCSGGTCIGEMTASDCADFGGMWYAGETCSSVDCPQDVSCNTGNGASPTGVDGAWTAGTSDTGSGYIRAADCSAPSVADVTVYGLALIYSGGWGDCADADTMGMTMDVMDSSYTTLATASASYSATNLVYAGVYALHGWTAAPGYSGSVGAVSAYSGSGGQGECWFLWMSADAGTSVVNDGTGWLAETFGVNYCITE